FSEKGPEKEAYLNGAETASTVQEEKPTGYIQCNPHPFDKEDADFKYVKGNVLPPETGSKNLIIPCHEFKSFQNAAQRDAFEQEIKFAKEVIRFAAACMNCRTNGTIHFGIEDGGEYVHGEIVGVPVPNKELFVKARDKYIKQCFSAKYHADAEHSIRPPRFVEVVGDGTGQQRFVIEVDIVPSLSVVKETFYIVKRPYYNNSASGTVGYLRPSIYKREGATSSIQVCSIAIQKMPEYVRDRDFEREKAERNEELSRDDVYRKLSELFTSIKKHMNSEVKYILVTNSCKKEDLENLSFLLGMRFFCVLDFDPNSKMQGLYSLYSKASPYFLEECITESGSLADDVLKDSFQRTSWIFCNGQNHSGEQEPYDAKTWMKTRREHLVKMISQICNAILPPGTFEVLFLMLSPANQVVAQAFHEFYAGMNGQNNIKCIMEGRENYNIWASLLQNSCNRETLNNLSIVGTKLSHLDNMIQTIQSSGLSVKQLLYDDTKYENLLPFIAVLRSDEYSCIDVDAKDEEWQEEIRDKEMHFYKGGKVSWMNFWFAENRHCGEIIKRDAYKTVNNHLNLVLERADSEEPVITVTISHQPGSGGSTVARHILWNFRKRLRCATVNTSYPVRSICEQAVKLQENEENGKSLPVLLLVEDCNEEYIEELKIHLGRAVADCPSKPNFILLYCKRSTVSKTFASASDIVHVNYNLSENEKMLFSRKLDDLKAQYKENSILTFVLMTKEYNQDYLTKSVNELLESINQTPGVLDLIVCIALLNHYVEGSYITGSQCEAFLNRCVHSGSSQPLTFESTLREAAGCLLSQLYEPTAEFLCIRVIHRKVAEEILSHKFLQSQAVTHLLEENLFFKHRSTTQVVKFIRQLFVQRKDNTDKVKHPFSSLITQISKHETRTKAVDVLEKACKCFDKDAFVTQQFARFLYNGGEFEKAEAWVKKARSLEPFNSYILHTEGQMYKKWFCSDNQTMQNEQQSSPQRLGKLIELALKAIEAFQGSQEESKSESDWNNAGYFGEVEVACYVVQLMSQLDIFKYKDGCHINLVKYLLIDWIPEQIDTAWKSFHIKLKGLHNNTCKAMESIYEHMAYFQPDKHTEEKPFEELTKSDKQFSYFFCFFNDSGNQMLRQENMEHLMPVLKCHKINHLGGGRFTKMFQLAPTSLEKIIQLCTNEQGFSDENDLKNYIFSQFALAINSHSSLEATIFKKKLCELSDLLCEMSDPGQSPFLYFIQVLLYWPEAEADNDSGEENNRCLINALNTMNSLYKTKTKDDQMRKKPKTKTENAGNTQQFRQHLWRKKKPTYPHFFLGSGSGFQQFILNTYRDEANYPWEELQRIEGWTEGNKLYVQGHCRESKVPIHRASKCSVPPGSRRVSFHLGFTMRGCVAYKIQNED
ncbi:sterile alpha motif domain-containing protein 9-like, partial [Heterodontus francisci]|uniref:sterile alpha motif domain-containing protein 9-like n=1 Tax=Heterodontus francisci TaxID=7792 RepID=UPI00355BFEC4